MFQKNKELEDILYHILMKVYLRGLNKILE